MDLKQIRCVLAAAEEMHFGRAARSLDMLPAGLGRQIRLLEEELGIALFARTTRSVVLTDAGRDFVRDARPLVDAADGMVERFRDRGRTVSRVIRLGAIDSAAAGLVPALIHDLHAIDPGLTIQLTEEKSIRLVPKLLSGRLDLAIIRPGAKPVPGLCTRFLLHETAVVALPASHALGNGAVVSISALADVAMIIPERRSRPHSHDLTMKLFEEEGLAPRIAQVAEEKQTILNMVSAGIGAAIVPMWSTRLGVTNVVFRRLEGHPMRGAERLPLAVAWQAHVRDANRDLLLGLLQTNLDRYAVQG
ncbi:LysR family transcriptional regulator [Aureimonas phyllosphaerae]|uniref:DNA-binding transcriptional LysR family regulator n=1 Tax=Aureimonas phyllosphaerae TaxID=1166078 RepID=A0A7W6BUT6_9HYPH|nr:LysR family transcriptional regulator [Aureimonas phyllosphaerae]MBB3937327.1 DNA-binding transcriptional LysR family regulator [Aureimonas phyllosphaerae]MBB3961334.1 DNA-binding transcriptional LysR family regulator [Aureimonas phyllosphaerae]SFF42016.1 DNA-binding transcriptional regulator, LysR family [Aureimonas phyllosphaerae]